MIGERVALLFGLFVAPLFLALYGHRLRDRGPRGRKRFWSAVIGYSFGMIIATVAMMAPPVWWAGGSFARDFAVHWAMLVGFVGGWLVGSLR